VIMKHSKNESGLNDTVEVENVMIHPRKSLNRVVGQHYDPQPYPFHDLIDDAYERIHMLHSGTERVTGYRSGLFDLDHVTGGFQPGELIVIASVSSMGKTTLAINIAQYLSVKKSEKVATVIFSLEMPKEQLAMRLISGIAGVEYGRALSGFLADSVLPKLDSVKELLRESRIYIDDTVGISVNELVAKVQHMKTDHDVGLIIIDYLQLMRGELKTDLSQDELTRITRKLKTLARELNISIIVLSQLDSSLEKRKNGEKRPTLRDLRDAGSLENDADLILFIYRESVYCKKCRRRDGSCKCGHERNAEITVAKHRNGSTGVVSVAYFGEYGSFKTI